MMKSKHGVLWQRALRLRTSQQALSPPLRAERNFMKRVLILGGGFGGIATAHRLKQKLGNSVEVILVDRRPYFMVGFRKSWALVGASQLDAGQKPIDSLSRIGVDVRRATIEVIQPQEKSATVDGE